MIGPSTASWMPSTFTPLRIGYAFVESFSVHYSSPPARCGRTSTTPSTAPSGTPSGTPSTAQPGEQKTKKLPGNICSKMEQQVYSVAMLLIRFLVSGYSKSTSLCSFLQEALESIAALCVALGNDPDMEKLDLDLSDIVLYTGITKQKDVWNECLRWLTTRGLMRSDGSFSGSQNRPTLVWADGRCITMLVP